MGRKDKILKLIIYVVVIVFIALGCSKGADIAEIYKDSLKELSSDNILGLMIRQGDYVYYVSRQSGDKIYKIKTDGNGKKRLNNDKSKIIGVKDSWVYYQKRDEKGAIYKISTDGKRRICITKDFTRNPILSGDWIYFISEYDSYLYRISLDGLTKIRVNNDYVLSFLLKKTGSIISIYQMRGNYIK